MPTDNPTLATFYEGWETYQKNLVNMIAPLTADQLALRLSGRLRTVHTLTVHIIAVRVRWFHDAAGAGNPEVVPLGKWDRRNARKRTAAELISGLETSWQLIRNALDHWSPADLEQPFEDSWQGEVVILTRRWIVWHVLEHDLHHGGELSFLLGANGLKGLDL